MSSSLKRTIRLPKLPMVILYASIILLIIIGIDQIADLYFLPAFTFMENNVAWWAVSGILLLYSVSFGVCANYFVHTVSKTPTRKNIQQVFRWVSLPMLFFTTGIAFTILRFSENTIDVFLGYFCLTIIATAVGGWSNKLKI